jgi:hypothetical protein
MNSEQFSRNEESRVLTNSAISSSGKLGLTETRLNVYPIKPSLDRLSKADPANVQEIVASQIELMTVYHNVVLDQAQHPGFLTTIFIQETQGLPCLLSSAYFRKNSL